MSIFVIKKEFRTKEEISDLINNITPEELKDKDSLEYVKSNGICIGLTAKKKNNNIIFEYKENKLTAEEAIEKLTGYSPIIYTTNQNLNK